MLSVVVLLWLLSFHIWHGFVEFLGDVSLEWYTGDDFHFIIMLRLMIRLKHWSSTTRWSMMSTLASAMVSAPSTATEPRSLLFVIFILWSWRSSMVLSSADHVHHTSEHRSLVHLLHRFHFFHHFIHLLEDFVID